MIVAHYSRDRVDKRVSYEVTWQMYHTARNALVRVCKRHGTTGPMGIAPITNDKSGPPRGWKLGDDECVFYIVDDQYNDEELYLYLELLDGRAATRLWFDDVVAMLSELPGWGIGVSTYCGYMLIFADRLLLNGPPFAHCGDVESVLAAVQAGSDKA